MIRKFVSKYLSTLRSQSDADSEEDDGVEVPKENGALMALVARSPQVEALEGACLDARPLLLKERYQASYERFEIDQVKSVTTAEGTWIVATIDLRACDFVNMLDLCIENPDAAKPFDIIDSIVVEYGGYKVDAMYTQQQLEVNAALHGRRVTHTRGKTRVPIALAPLHRNSLSFPSTKEVKLRLKINFKKPYSHDLEVYGMKYYVEFADRKKIRDGDHQFASPATLYDPVGACEIRAGSNSIDVSHFYGAAYALYFWGLDKSKIKNVRFDLNGSSFYDGTVDALEHAKAERGLADVEPVVIFFSDRGIEEESAADSSVNFSKIDTKTLVIETEEACATLRVAAITFKTIEYSGRAITVGGIA